MAAVEVLYASDLRNVPPHDILTEQELGDAYAEHLVSGVFARKTEIDRTIGSHSRGWTTERMSPVDRNVLRVGVLELMEGEVPPAVAIDEAVDIAKHFSGEEAGRFVNGVLEAVRQSLGRGDDGASGSDA
ncbi:MAG: transcription antitermination factor NusB [Actinomycetota bacterium]